MQIEHLKALVLTGRSVVSPGSPGNGTNGSSSGSRRSETEAAVAEAVERERELAAALIRSAEQERDELQLRQDEFAHALSRYEAENAELRDRIIELQDAVHVATEQRSTTCVDEREDERRELSGVTTRKKTAAADKDLVGTMKD
jgi:chromosome segregation ATPase